MNIELAKFKSLNDFDKQELVQKCNEDFKGLFANEYLPFRDVALSIEGSGAVQGDKRRVKMVSLKCGHEVTYEPLNQTASNSAFCKTCGKAHALFTRSIFEKAHTSFDFEYLYLSFDSRPAPNDLSKWLGKDIRMVNDSIYRIQFAISLGISRIGESLPNIQIELEKMAKEIGATTVSADLRQRIFATKAEDVFRKLTYGASTWAKTKLVFQLAMLVGTEELVDLETITDSIRAEANDLVRDFLKSHQLPLNENHFLFSARDLAHLT